MRTPTIIVLSSLALLASAASPARPADTAPKPNIIFILADDMY